MSEEFRLPPELQTVADLIDSQPVAVQDMFRYALVVMLVDDEKARVIGTRFDEAGEYLKVQTNVGDTFEIYKPPLSDELEKKLVEEIRQITSDDQLTGNSIEID